MQDIDTITQFGGQLQREADRDRAARAIRRNPRQWVRSLPDEVFPDYEWYFWEGRGLRPAAVPSSILELAITDFLRAEDSVGETVATVESLDYRNPLELVASVGIVTYAVFVSVRDWHERRRLNRLFVDDYESAVLTRIEVRQHLVDGLETGQYRLSEEQIDRLLTPDVSTAFKNIGNALPTLELLADGDEPPSA
ncbi:hypothetical protein R4P47_01530 [Rhodococcus sp. IEGM 1370]|uniref:hypothetical protein n=1 Tax=Rhodococcus sp. IEGM 1370 TaxID=3082222 RepID=UPI0029545D1C|nr:hypothetical protein [Rhodococcus sp. IEGM 1370]MDV8075222.1 hypothetical protein [Rhodococcus sp. IEGM 1370]